MNIGGKYISKFVWAFIISLLLLTEAVATTEFYLFPNDVKRKVDCDYLEIKNNQALCTVNNLLITYDLARIKKLELVNKGKSFHFQTITQETIERINDLNSDKKHRQKGKEQVKSKQTKSASQKFGIIQQLSFDFFPDFVQSLKDNFNHQVGNSTFSTILLISGLVVFLIGSFGFLIATFRVGILWGLSCIFLPFVSFIFLIVHWKVASKPFFVSLLGFAIAFSGTMLVPAGEAVQSIAKYNPITTFDNKKKNNGRFQCSGKIYCSEMSSCAEAKFYLRNCPGTKMDGNNDGIPCEKQWCGH
jgi:hypothetical protein